MTVEADINALNTTVTNLTTDVNEGKASLDAFVSAANRYKNEATYTTVRALAHRDAAETLKDAAYAETQSPSAVNPIVDLSALEGTSAETAQNIFVYDTSLDSDGGAWRHKTDNTAWYNEASGNYRGTRKEFPAVAVIVANSTGDVIIYDGDDPTFPMWMKIFVNNRDRICIAAKNGQIAIGNWYQAAYNYGGNGLLVYDFPGDRIKTGWLNSSNPSYAPAISQRLLSGSFGNNFTTAPQVQIRYYNFMGLFTIRDVAMTVLPNAPIDVNTGLPTPTIAVAIGKFTVAGGGVCLISGPAGPDTVVDIPVDHLAAGGYETTFVDFGPNNELMFNSGYNTAYQRFHVFHELPTTDQVWNNYDTSAISYVINQQPFSYMGMADKAKYVGENQFAVCGTGLYHNALTMFHEYPADKAQTMVCYIEKNYNTGWQVGDIRLATMCDTNTKPLSSDVNLVKPFSDFSTLNETYWSVSGNTATVVTSGLYTGISDAGVFEPSQAYEISFDYNVTSGAIRMFAGGGGQNVVEVKTTGSGSHTEVYKVLPYGGGTYSVSQGAADTTGSISNPMAKELLTDQSIKNNHLRPVGTIIREPVNEGCDLVGYSGFDYVNRTNYLRLPYTSDLEFGTGDFSVQFWMKMNGTTISNRALMGYVNPDNPNEHKWRIYHAWSGTHSGLQFMGANSSNNDVPKDVWTHICSFRKSGVVGTYVNGKLIASYTPYSAVDITTSNYEFRIGGTAPAGSGNAPNHHHFALLRISATVPTEQQLQKICQDEIKLFQPHTRCSWSGSDHAAHHRIRSLAYDKAAGLTYIGNYGTVDTFDGIACLSTSDTSGLAVAASNGTVVTS